VKKVLFALLTLALVLPVFADDAQTMPARVFRTYFVGTYANITKSYDSDGDKQNLASGDITAYNFAAALEFGTNDWITGALQWAPGYTFSSEADGSNYKKANLADPADLFIGGKIQLIGPKTPILKSETVRLSMGTGVKVPLSHPDWEEEYDSWTSSKDFLLSPADKHVLGLGARLYADYLFTPTFYLNLYSEFLYYPGSVKATDASLVNYATVAAVRGSVPSYDPSIKYGYDFTLELEPHYNLMLKDGLQLETGLPLTYKMSPALDVSDDSLGYISNLESSESSNILTIAPNAALFFMKAALPIEVKLSYSQPLMGKNRQVANSLTCIVRVYAKY
jgi:hypothetical protein